MKKGNKLYCNNCESVVRAVKPGDFEKTIAICSLCKTKLKEKGKTAGAKVTEVFLDLDVRQRSKRRKRFICKQCNEEFYAQRADASFCSVRCRQRANYISEKLPIISFPTLSSSEISKKINDYVV